MVNRSFTRGYGLLILVFMLFSVVPVWTDEPFSSGPFTVDQLVEEALRQHPDLVALEIDVAAAKAGRLQAGKWMNPELSGDLGQKTVGETDDRGWVYGVELLQTFEYPGKAAIRKAIADKHIELAEAGRVLFRHALEADIRAAAGACLEMDALNRIVNETIAGIETALVEFLRRKPAGIPQTIDKMLIEASLLEIRTEAMDIAKEVDDRRSELNVLLGRPSDSTLEIIPSVSTLATSDYTAISFSEHPAMTMRSIEREQAALEIQASRIRHRPDIEAGPFYHDESVGEDEYTVGLMFTVPLPWWNRSQGDVLQAHAREEQVMAAAQRAERELTAERDRRQRELRHQQARMDQYSPERIVTLRDAAALASQQFLTGVITSSQYIDLQQAFLSALQHHHESRAEWLRASAALNALTPSAERQ